MKKITLFVMALLMMVTTSMAATKVAYIITSSYSTYADGCSLDTDPVLNALKANFEVEVLDLPDGEEADYASIAETYKVAVLSEAMNGKGTLGIGLEKLVGMMPVVSMKAYFYTDGRWSWAAPANPATKPTTGITVKPDFRDHALFKGLNISADGVIQLYDGTGNSNNIQGFKDLVSGSPIDLEMVYATASTDETINTVHEVVMNDYKYVLVPLSSDNLETTLPDAAQLIVNAVNYVTDGGVSVEEANKIAYLYDSSKAGYDVESDPAYAILSGTDNVLEAIDIKDFTAESTDTVNALESNYDLVIVSEGPNSGHKFASSLKGMVNRVPMLNMKSFFYKKGVWGWGAGSNPSPATGTIVLTEAGAAHPIFEDLGYSAGDEVELYIPGDYTGNIIQGYTVSEGSLIADDAVLATIGNGINAIHEHGKNNTYMLYPFSSDAAIAGVEFTDDATNLLLAVVDYLADTKSKVRQATKPAIEVAYTNGATIVTITSIVEGATIHYTVDGTEPTSASPVYTGDLTFTQACVVKALVSATGYNDSEVASAEVVVKVQAAKPVITVTDGENGTKVITMTGDSIHYNLSDAVPTTASPVYTEPIIVSRSTDISAIGVGVDMLDSEPAFAVAEIEAYPFRKDTLATITISEAEGFTQVYTDADGVEQTVKPNSKKYLWNEKKGWSYYYANGDSTEVNTDTRIADFNNGWIIESSGQAMYYHADGSSEVAGGYGPATSADAGFTKGGLQWAGIKSGDPFSGYLYSTGDNKFTGPFDVAVWLCAGNNPSEGKTENMEICTSTDGQTWTLLDTVSVVVDKMVHRVVAHYDGNESVYLRFGYAGGYKTKLMMMQVQILGVGGSSQIELPVAGDAEVVAVQVYNAAGIQQNGLQKGLNIVRKLYANGAVEVIKVMK